MEFASHYGVVDKQIKIVYPSTLWSILASILEIRFFCQISLQQWILKQVRRVKYTQLCALACQGGFTETTQFSSDTFEQYIHFCANMKY